MAKPEYDVKQKELVNNILGEHMHRVITSNAVDMVRRNGIDRKLTHLQAFLRWGRAMAWVADPITARKTPSALEATEINTLEAAARPQSAAKLTCEALRKQKALRQIIRGQANLTEITTSRMVNLLVSGSTDSLSWINVLRRRGVPYDEIVHHPVFPTMTTLTSPAHSLMLMVYGERSAEHVPDNVPRRRADVMDIIRSSSDQTRALAYSEAEAEPPYKDLEARGDCPAARMRDAQGTLWLNALVERAVELHQGTQ